MSVCRHFSQRATCPPRAAVRQLSMADITLSWPRLTWPALALRQGGPVGACSNAAGAEIKLGRCSGERTRSREEVLRGLHASAWSRPVPRRLGSG